MMPRGTMTIRSGYTNGFGDSRTCISGAGTATKKQPANIAAIVRISMARCISSSFCAPRAPGLFPKRCENEKVNQPVASADLRQGAPPGLVRSLWRDVQFIPDLLPSLQAVAFNASAACLRASITSPASFSRVKCMRVLRMVSWGRSFISSSTSFEAGRAARAAMRISKAVLGEG